MPVRTLYAHNIRVSSLNEVETAFNQYLKEKEPNALISERRLTVIPHNSFRALDKSFVSLNRAPDSTIQS